MAHIKTVRLPMPRRIPATDFWNSLAGSGSSRRPVWDTLLPRPLRYHGLNNPWTSRRRCAPAVRPLQGFWDRSDDESHEVPAATWLPRRADWNGCALVTAQQTPSPPFRQGGPSRLDLCSTRNPSAIRSVGAQLSLSPQQRRSRMRPGTSHTPAKDDANVICNMYNTHKRKSAMSQL